MSSYKKLIHINVIIISVFLSSISFADNHNIYEILDLIKKDLKTLEKAVYSSSLNLGNSNDEVNLDQNSEDVLTRHLLKLSEIESQFQNLTNKFEEINFKLDKLSNRFSKTQTDNQLRFQDIENVLTSSNKDQKTSLKKKKLFRRNFARQFTTSRFRLNIV